MKILLHLGEAGAIAPSWGREIGAMLAPHAPALLDATTIPQHASMAALVTSQLAIFWVQHSASARSAPLAGATGGSVRQMIGWLKEPDAPPGIVLGPILDLELEQFLEQSGAAAFVAVTAPQQFADNFKQAVADVVAARASGSTVGRLRAYNIRSELMLSVRHSGLSWHSTGGYLRRFERFNATHWARPLVAQVQEAKRRNPDYRDLRHELDRIGDMLGACLLPDDEPQDLYRRVCEMAAPPHRIPVHIVTEREWSHLPFELARLPGSDLSLGQKQPVIRRVRGLVRPPRRLKKSERGLRVLLVGCATGGAVNCAQECAARQGGLLPPLHEVATEIEWIRKEFEDLKTRKPHLVETVEVLDDRNLSIDALREALAGKEWDIFHFSGHGSYCEREGASGGCLFLADPSVRGAIGHGTPLRAVGVDYWTGHFARSANDAVIYLSCCHAGESGLVSSVAANASCNVIGFGSPVNDRAARELATEFYRSFVRTLETDEGDVAQHILNAKIEMARGNDAAWLAAGFCILCRTENNDA